MAGEIVLALAAGFLSFSSPCCLPLLPGYLGFVSGTAGPPSSGRRTAVPGAILFVGGFAVVFTALGASASTLGRILLTERPALEIIGGAFMVAVGLLIALDTAPRWLQGQWRLSSSRFTSGTRGAFPLGMVFALGWTPCIGPILAGVLGLAAASSSLNMGILLLLVYSLGLGLPFIALAWAYDNGSRSTKLLRRFAPYIARAGGAVLVAMGVLLILGDWTTLFTPLLRWYSNLNWPPI